MKIPQVLSYFWANNTLPAHLVVKPDGFLSKYLKKVSLLLINS